MSKKITKIELQLNKLENSVSNINIKMTQKSREKKMRNLTKNKNLLYQRIDSKRTQYLDHIELSKKNQQANCAIVLFRSMEGQKRALKAFKVSKCRKLFYYMLCCFKQKDLAETKF